MIKWSGDFKLHSEIKGKRLKQILTVTDLNTMILVAASRRNSLTSYYHGKQET